MNPIYTLAILLVIIFAVAEIISFLKKLNSWEEIDEESLEIKKFVYEKIFFTPNELNFYRQLEEYLADKEVILLSKVRLADIFWVRDQKKDKIAFGMFQKIKAKHIDFVISDLNWKLKFCIELDDCTHDKEKKWDIFKNKLFDTMNIEFIRYKTAKKYTFSELFPSKELKINEEPKEIESTVEKELEIVAIPLLENITESQV
ncbi:MAG: hypothetical protein ACD_3C00086G0028 [uncultured bacterium (gcode 4)]|uniref:DUF2726 domain-containing protein n=1 Tax=uncultured bacterium (gcode 4) TaxID=1234023 RepID=K2GDA0_9BACT|nr:MAG: hypothetical protein ACD_3C00086G0028 [uncultured bacterium (gcode 4)]